MDRFCTACVRGGTAHIAFCVRTGRSLARLRFRSRALCGSRPFADLAHTRRAISTSAVRPPSSCTEDQHIVTGSPATGLSSASRVSARLSMTDCGPSCAAPPRTRSLLPTPSDDTAPPPPPPPPQSSRAHAKACQDGVTQPTSLLEIISQRCCARSTTTLLQRRRRDGRLGRSAFNPAKLFQTIPPVNHAAAARRAPTPRAPAHAVGASIAEQPRRALSTSPTTPSLSPLSPSRSQPSSGSSRPHSGSYPTRRAVLDRANSSSPASTSHVGASLLPRSAQQHMYSNDSNSRSNMNNTNSTSNTNNRANSTNSSNHSDLHTDASKNNCVHVNSTPPPPASSAVVCHTDNRPLRPSLLRKLMRSVTKKCLPWDSLTQQWPALTELALFPMRRHWTRHYCCCQAATPQPHSYPLPFRAGAAAAGTYSTAQQRNGGSSTMASPPLFSELPVLLCAADTGTGKSVLIPLYLLDAHWRTLHTRLEECLRRCSRTAVATAATGTESDSEERTARAVDMRENAAQADRPMSRPTRNDQSDDTTAAAAQTYPTHTQSAFVECVASASRVCIVVAQPTRLACVELARYVSRLLSVSACDPSSSAELTRTTTSRGVNTRGTDTTTASATTDNEDEEEEDETNDNKEELLLGTRVGYAVSGDARFGPDTELIFATPGYILAALHSNNSNDKDSLPCDNRQYDRKDSNNTIEDGGGMHSVMAPCGTALSATDQRLRPTTLVIDEAHCRNIDTDMLLAWCKLYRWQRYNGSGISDHASNNSTRGGHKTSGGVSEERCVSLPEMAHAKGIWLRQAVVMSATMNLSAMRDFLRDTVAANNSDAMTAAAASVHVMRCAPMYACHAVECSRGVRVDEPELTPSAVTTSAPPARADHTNRHPSNGSCDRDTIGDGACPTNRINPDPFAEVDYNESESDADEKRQLNRTVLQRGAHRVERYFLEDLQTNGAFTHSRLLFSPWLSFHAPRETSIYSNHPSHRGSNTDGNGREMHVHPCDASLANRYDSAKHVAHDLHVPYSLHHTSSVDSSTRDADARVTISPSSQSRPLPLLLSMEGALVMQSLTRFGRTGYFENSNSFTARRGTMLTQHTSSLVQFLLQLLQVMHVRESGCDDGRVSTAARIRHDAPCYRGGIRASPLSAAGVLVFLPGFAEMQLVLQILEQICVREGDVMSQSNNTIHRGRHARNHNSSCNDAACASLSRAAVGHVMILRYGDLRFSVPLLHAHAVGCPAEQLRLSASSATAAPLRLILATDVAESSLTIANVRVVVDLGLTRRFIADALTGTTMRQTALVDRSSLQQRCGRVGRTGSGVVIHLVPRSFFAEEEGAEGANVAAMRTSFIAATATRTYPSKQPAAAEERVPMDAFSSAIQQQPDHHRCRALPALQDSVSSILLRVKRMTANSADTSDTQHNRSATCDTTIDTAMPISAKFLSSPGRAGAGHDASTSSHAAMLLACMPHPPSPLSLETAHRQLVDMNLLQASQHTAFAAPSWVNEIHPPQPSVVHSAASMHPSNHRHNYSRALQQCINCSTLTRKGAVVAALSLPIEQAVFVYHSFQFACVEDALLIAAAMTVPSLLLTPRLSMHDMSVTSSNSDAMPTEIAPSPANATMHALHVPHLHTPPRLSSRRGRDGERKDTADTDAAAEPVTSLLNQFVKHLCVQRALAGCIPAVTTSTTHDDAAHEMRHGARCTRFCEDRSNSCTPNSSSSSSSSSSKDIYHAKGSAHDTCSRDSNTNSSAYSSSSSSSSSCSHASGTLSEPLMLRRIMTRWYTAATRDELLAIQTDLGLNRGVMRAVDLTIAQCCGQLIQLLQDEEQTAQNLCRNTRRRSTLRFRDDTNNANRNESETIRTARNTSESCNRDRIAFANTHTPAASVNMSDTRSTLLDPEWPAAYRAHLIKSLERLRRAARTRAEQRTTSSMIAGVLQWYGAEEMLRGVLTAHYTNGTTSCSNNNNNYKKNNTNRFIAMRESGARQLLQQTAPQSATHNNTYRCHHGDRANYITAHSSLTTHHSHIAHPCSPNASSTHHASNYTNTPGQEGDADMYAAPIAPYHHRTRNSHCIGSARARRNEENMCQRHPTLRAAATRHTSRPRRYCYTFADISDRLCAAFVAAFARHTMRGEDGGHRQHHRRLTRNWGVLQGSDMQTCTYAIDTRSVSPLPLWRALPDVSSAVQTQPARTQAQRSEFVPTTAAMQPTTAPATPSLAMPLTSASATAAPKSRAGHSFTASDVERAMHDYLRGTGLVQLELFASGRTVAACFSDAACTHVLYRWLQGQHVSGGGGGDYTALPRVRHFTPSGKYVAHMDDQDKQQQEEELTKQVSGACMGCNAEGARSTNNSATARSRDVCPAPANRRATMLSERSSNDDDKDRNAMLCRPCVLPACMRYGSGVGDASSVPRTAGACSPMRAHGSGRVLLAPLGASLLIAAQAALQRITMEPTEQTSPLMLNNRASMTCSTARCAAAAAVPVTQCGHTIEHATKAEQHEQQGRGTRPVVKAAVPAGEHARHVADPDAICWNDNFGLRRTLSRAAAARLGFGHLLTAGELSSDHTASGKSTESCSTCVYRSASSVLHTTPRSSGGGSSESTRSSSRSSVDCSSTYPHTPDVRDDAHATPSTRLMLSVSGPIHITRGIHWKVCMPASSGMAYSFSLRNKHAHDASVGAASAHLPTAQSSLPLPRDARPIIMHRTAVHAREGGGSCAYKICEVCHVLCLGEGQFQAHCGSRAHLAHLHHAVRSNVSCAELRRWCGGAAPEALARLLGRTHRDAAAPSVSSAALTQTRCQNVSQRDDADTNVEHSAHSDHSATGASPTNNLSVNANNWTCTTDSHCVDGKETAYIANSRCGASGRVHPEYVCTSATAAAKPAMTLQACRISHASFLNLLQLPTGAAPSRTSRHPHPAHRSAEDSTVAGVGDAMSRGGGTALAVAGSLMSSTPVDCVHWRTPHTPISEATPRSLTAHHVWVLDTNSCGSCNFSTLSSSSCSPPVGLFILAGYLTASSGHFLTALLLNASHTWVYGIMIYDWGVWKLPQPLELTHLDVLQHLLSGKGWPGYVAWQEDEEEDGTRHTTDSHADIHGRDGHDAYNADANRSGVSQRVGLHWCVLSDVCPRYTTSNPAELSRICSCAQEHHSSTATRDSFASHMPMAVSPPSTRPGFLDVQRPGRSADADALVSATILLVLQEFLQAQRGMVSLSSFVERVLAKLDRLDANVLPDSLESASAHVYSASAEHTDNTNNSRQADGYAGVRLLDSFLSRRAPQRLEEILRDVGCHFNTPPSALASMHASQIESSMHATMRVAYTDAPADCVRLTRSQVMAEGAALEVIFTLPPILPSMLPSVSFAHHLRQHFIAARQGGGMDEDEAESGKDSLACDELF